jgi:hypothetical protein
VYLVREQALMEIRFNFAEVPRGTYGAAVGHIYKLLSWGYKKEKGLGYAWRLGCCVRLLMAGGEWDYLSSLMIRLR